MCPESFPGFRFDLGPLLQGQIWFFIPIMAYISLLLVVEVLDVKMGNHVPQIFWWAQI